MVNLKSQYQKLKVEIDTAILSTIGQSRFIGGAPVKSFEDELSHYLDIPYVISCANGTDALQIALQAIGAVQGDEVIIPAFTYVATAEVIALLGLTPVMVDVNLDTFNINIDQVRSAITEKTKAIIPVHLFGQSSDMTAIMNIAEQHNLYIIAVSYTHLTLPTILLV